MKLKLKKVKSFIIDRAIWLRGEGNEKSFLRRKSDGKMCCVGIYYEACGVPKRCLTGASTVRYLKSPWAGKDDQYLLLYDENDDEITPEPVREMRIAKEFAKIGIKVKFVGASK